MYVLDGIQGAMFHESLVYRILCQANIEEVGLRQNYETMTLQNFVTHDYYNLLL